MSVVWCVCCEKRSRKTHVNLKIIPIYLNLTRRGSYKGHNNNTYRNNEHKISSYIMSFFVHSLLISWDHLQENNIQVPDTSCNVPIWLVWDIYPNVAIRWVWDPNPNVAIWLQHTTLHTINEFFFPIKKRWLKKLLSAYEANIKFKEKRKNIYWPIYLTQSNNYTCLKLKLKLKLQHILKSPSCTFH